MCYEWCGGVEDDDETGLAAGGRIVDPENHPLIGFVQRVQKENGVTTFATGGYIKSPLSEQEIQQRKLNFIARLVSNDIEVLALMNSFYDPPEISEPEPFRPTTYYGTLWSEGAPAENGFRMYQVAHHLGTRDVAVEIDNDPQIANFTYRAIDDNTIVILSSEPLFGAEVSVEIA